MNLQRKTYNSSGEKALDFFIGFAGFFVINGILWGLLSVADGLLATVAPPYGNEPANTVVLIVSLTLYCGVFVINIAALILLGLTRYWMALGILGAFTASLILAICASLVVGGLCFALLFGLSQAEGGAFIVPALRLLLQ